MFENFDLKAVRLKDADFSPRRALVKRYIESFDLDRLMHSFRKNAGIETHAEPLGGWESENCGLRGHFVGHFLSACSKFAYGDEDRNLKQKAYDIVDILEQCACDNGYLSAFEEETLDILEFEENRDVWAPYYTLDKILQGLIDCYVYLKNDKALRLALNLAGYIYKRFEKLNYWKIDGILRCTKVNPQNEFGGIGDAIYQLYAITQDPKMLELAQIFDRNYFLRPLAKGEDVLENLHANTHLPLIIGAMKRYNITREEMFKEAAHNFYDFLIGRTFANGNSSSKATAYIKGGVSEKSEHWGSYGFLGDALTGGESESCCAHNTEKIAEQLFRWTGDVKYLDHIETLKYNAVLNSASAVTGLSQYHQPMGMNAEKKFSEPYDSFWCCTASGIEAMSEIQNNIWYKKEDSILVNMFVASHVHWDEKGLELFQETRFPDQRFSTIKIKTEKPSCFTICFKSSAIKGIQINGVDCDLRVKDGLVVIWREFNDGDCITIEIEAQLKRIPLLGHSNMEAYMYGKVLLAQKGPYVPIKEDVLEELKENSEGSLEFYLETATKAQLKFVPLFRIENEQHTVYQNTEYDKEEPYFQHAPDGSMAYQ